MVLLYFEESGALGEEAVTSGHNAINAENAVCPTHCRVISALGLALCDEFDQRLLHWFATRVSGDGALDQRATGRLGNVAGRSLSEAARAQQKQRHGCGKKLHECEVGKCGNQLKHGPRGSASVHSIPEKCSLQELFPRNGASLRFLPFFALLHSFSPV